MNVSFEQTYRYQYCVAAERLHLPGFQVEKCGQQWLHIGSALRCVRLVDRHGKAFGFCFGIAVDHDGELPEDVFPKWFDSSNDDALDQFEAYLPKLAGRYGIVTELGGREYFHCDPVGMIGAVFAPETRRLAASTFLCIDRTIDWHPLYAREEVEKGEGSYGFHHTCDAQVMRMNASHRMDLETFETSRFWPRKDDRFDAAADKLGEIFDEMISVAGNIISRMQALAPTALPLSGGNDSRILMALSGAAGQKRFSQVFSHINTYANRRDAHVAQLLCKAKDVSFEVHDKKVVSVPRHVRRLAERRYRIGSGTLAAVPKEIQNGLFLSVLQDAIVMRGHQTNIMRGQYLISSDPKKWQEPAWQIRMMRLVGNGKFNRSVAARFSADFTRFYDDLPNNARERSADFIFFETIVPAALGTLFPGQDHAFYLSPFNSRRLVQLSMQPDTAYRLSNAPTTDILLRSDPDLAVIPFAYELPADLNQTAESEERTGKRIAQGMERARSMYADAPKVR